MLASSVIGGYGEYNFPPPPRARIYSIGEGPQRMQTGLHPDCLARQPRPLLPFCVVGEKTGAHRPETIPTKPPAAAAADNNEKATSLSLLPPLLSRTTTPHFCHHRDESEGSLLLICLCHVLPASNIAHPTSTEKNQTVRFQPLQHVGVFVVQLQTKGRRCRLTRHGGGFVVVDATLSRGRFAENERRLPSAAPGD
jgi:hypothetical protein